MPFACLRSTDHRVDVVSVAREFSPRIQRYGSVCVVLDVSGLGRLLGGPDAIGAELCRAVVERVAPDRVAIPSGSGAAPSGPRYRGIYAHPREHAAQCFDRFDPGDLSLGGTARGAPTVDRGGGRTPRIDGAVAMAPTQIAALLVARAHPGLSVITDDPAAALAAMPVPVLSQWLAEIHDVTFLRGKAVRSAAAVRPAGGPWPSWEACEYLFDVLQRWGVRTLGELAALPPDELSGRIGRDGLALQRLACGIDARPLVPDPEVQRFVERMELEWPIDGLEPLSFVLARLLDPLSASLERADRGAAAIRLDLRLVDRTTHQRVLQLPAAMRDPRVLRTLLLLDLESHPPSAAIDVVAIEADPAPARIVQYSLVERAMPSAETVATLTARLGALVGESRCGTPVLLDTHRPDGFEMRAFQGARGSLEGSASMRRERRTTDAGRRDENREPRMADGGRRLYSCALRRFRPPVAVRVAVEHGRPVHVAIDRRGMPGGTVVQAAGPWRSSGGWWDADAGSWDRDEWDAALGDGSVCRLSRERRTDRWLLDAVVD